MRPILIQSLASLAAAAIPMPEERPTIYRLTPGPRRYRNVKSVSAPKPDQRCKRRPAGTPKAVLVADHKAKMARKARGQ